MVSKKIASLAAGALLVASTAASAQVAPRNADALSISGAMRAGPEGSDNKLAGSALVVPGLFLLAVFAVALLAYSSQDDSPSSP